eukprot:scaffold113917_cov20-Tisochrysis_lutea.AAC.3
MQLPIAHITCRKLGLNSPSAGACMSSYGVLYIVFRVVGAAAQGKQGKTMCVSQYNAIFKSPAHAQFSCSGGQMLKDNDHLQVHAFSKSICFNTATCGYS